MKIYTLTYDDARPTKQQVNIPTNSDYKIGIKVIGSKDAGKVVSAAASGGWADAIILAEDFNLYPQQVTLVGDDGSTISADPELTNGYVTFTLKAGDEANFTKYKVQVKNDTFDGIQYSPVMEGTNSTTRLKNIICTLSCDTPTTIYPSDKIQAIDKDGKMHSKYGSAGQSTVIYYYNVKDSEGQVITDSSYSMIPYCAENTFPSADIKGGVRRNNCVHITTQTGYRYDIAAKYTDEMISDGDTLNISYNKSVAPHSDYYIQFAVIPYENTFDLAVNTFKSQQGDIGDNPTDMATTEYVDNAVSGKVSGSSVGQAPAILSATSVYASDWATLSSTADENTMYVVLPDPVLPTRVKYTTASGLPDWESDIVGQIKGGDGTPTTQIPNVSDIEEISFGSNVTSIDQSAFCYCEDIKSVTIPNSVTSIGGNVFDSCAEISAITIPDSVTIIGGNAFYGCSGIRSLTIGSGVTSIGWGAFGACTSITSVTIPSNVTSIGGNVFEDCSSLESVTFSGKDMATVQGMDDYSDWGIRSGCVLHCTDGDITIA